jgi:hypothetical protein
MCSSTPTSAQGFHFETSFGQGSLGGLTSVRLDPMVAGSSFRSPVTSSDRQRFGFPQEDWDRTRDEMTRVLERCAREGQTIAYSDLVERVRTIKLQPNDYALAACSGNFRGVRCPRKRHADGSRRSQGGRHAPRTRLLRVSAEARSRRYRRRSLLGRRVQTRSPRVPPITRATRAHRRHASAAAHE